MTTTLSTTLTGSQAGSPSASASPAPTHSASACASPSASALDSLTPSALTTVSLSAPPTPLPSATGSASTSDTHTASQTSTRTLSLPITRSAGAATPTGSSSASVSTSSTQSQSASPGVSGSPSASLAASHSPQPTPSYPPSASLATATVAAASASPCPSSSSSAHASACESASLASSASQVPGSGTPTASLPATASLQPSRSASASGAASAAPSPSTPPSPSDTVTGSVTVTASPTPTPTSSPSLGPIRQLADELASFAFRASLWVLSPTILRRPGPRLLANATLLFTPSALTALQAQSWNDGDWASLLLNGSLAAPDALLPARPTPTATPHARPGAGAAAPELPVHTVTTSEPVVLMVDLWAFQTAGSAPLAAVGRGAPAGLQVSAAALAASLPAAAAAAAAAALPPPAPAASSGAGSATGVLWRLPRPYGDPQPPGFTQATPPTSGTTGTAPTGYHARATAVLWTLRGYPAGGVYGVGGAGPAPSGAPGLAAFAAAAGNSSAGGLHLLTFSTPSGKLLVPQGALLPGYVYRVSADGALRVSWGFEPVLPASARWGGAGAPFVRASRLRGLQQQEALDASCRGCNFLIQDSASAAFSTARAPLLYIHTPPLPQPRAPAQQALALPPTGASTKTLFTAATGEWVAVDGGAAVTAAAPPPPAQRAAFLSSAAPLPYALSLALASASRADQALPAAAAAAASPAAACAGFPPPPAASALTPAAFAPWQAALDVMATSLGGSASALCTAAVGAVAGALSGSAYSAPALPLLVSFRSLGANYSAAFAASPLLAGILPNATGAASGGLLPPVPWGGLLRAQPGLATPSTWPGSALGAPSASTSASFYLAGASPTAAELVAVGVFVADEYGSTGVAYAAVALQALLSLASLGSSSGLLAAAGSLTVNVSASDVAANPFSALQALQGSAGAMGVLGAYTVASNASDAGAVRAAVQGAAASLSASIDTALTAISALSGRTASSAAAGAPPALSDDAMGSIVSSLASLTAAPSLLTPGTASSCVSALATGLALSTGRPGGLGAAPLAPFPLATGVAVLGVLSNVVAGTVNSSATSDNATASNPAVISAMPLLGNALLRAAVPGDPPISITTFDPSAVQSVAVPLMGNASSRALQGGTAQSYCGSAITMAVARLSAPSAGSRAQMATAVSTLVPPCLSRPPSFSAAYPAGASLPGMSLSAPLFAALKGAVGGALNSSFDVLVTQWSRPPMSGAKGISTIVYASKPTVALGSSGAGAGAGGRALGHGAAALGARIAGGWEGGSASASASSSQHYVWEPQVRRQAEAAAAAAAAEARSSLGSLASGSLLAQAAVAWEVVTRGQVGGEALSGRSLAPSPLLHTLQSWLPASSSGRRRLAPGDGDVSGGAISAAIAALAASLPASSVPDLLPNRPIDTRVVSAELSSGGAVVATGDTTLPFIITLPLSDTSILRADATSSSGFRVDIGQGAFVSPVINFTCPRSPHEALGGGISSVYASPPALAGTAAPAVVLNITSLAFNAALVSVTTTASGAGAVGGLSALASNPAGSAVSSAEAAAAAAAAAGAGPAVISAGIPPSPSPAPAIATAQYAYTLTLPCGGSLGNLSVLCGPGAEGLPAVYACPAVVPVPTCLYWDGGANAWSTRGCSVASVTAASVTCSCTHLSNFAARFVAAVGPSPNVFALATPYVRTTTINTDPSLLLLLLGLCALCAGTAAAFARADAQGMVRYSVALSCDAEVRFLRQLAEAQGRAWVMDRAAHAVEGTPLPLLYWARAYAAVGLARLGAAPLARLVAPPAPRLVFLGSSGGSGGGKGAAAAAGALRLEDDGGTSASNSSFRVPKEDIVAAGVLSTLPGGAFNDSHSQTFAETASPTLAALFLRLLQSLDRFKLATHYREQEEEEEAGPGGSKGGSKGGASASASASGLLAQFIAEGRAPFASAATFVYDPTRGLVPEVVKRGDERAFAARRELVRLVGVWREAMEGGGVCSALWALRSLLWTGAARAYYLHPVLGLFTRFDPVLPRAARATVLLVCAAQALFTSAFAYAFYFGRPELPDLPPISAGSCAVLALLVCATSTLTYAAATALFQRAGWRELQWRFPALFVEYRRREAAERLLRFSPTAALLKSVTEGRALAVGQGGGGVTGRFLLDAAARGKLEALAAAPAVSGGAAEAEPFATSGRTSNPGTSRAAEAAATAAEAAATAGAVEEGKASEAAAEAAAAVAPSLAIGGAGSPPLAIEGADSAAPVPAPAQAPAADAPAAAPQAMWGCDEKIELEAENSDWVDPPRFCTHVFPELVGWCRKGDVHKRAHLRRWAVQRQEQVRQQVALAIERQAQRIGSEGALAGAAAQRRRRRGQRQGWFGACCSPSSAPAEFLEVADTLIYTAAQRGVDISAVLLESELDGIEEEERALLSNPRAWSRDGLLGLFERHAPSSAVLKPWKSVLAGATRASKVAPAPPSSAAQSIVGSESGEAMPAAGAAAAAPYPAHASAEGCTLESVAAYAVAYAVIAWFAFFTIVFSLLHSQAVCASVVAIFFFWVLFYTVLFSPAYTALEVAFSYIVSPTFTLLVGWLPVLGALTGAAQRTLAYPFDAPHGPLLGRLRNVTLLRGAAQASLLPPDAALAAHAHPMLLATLLHGASLKAKARELDDPFLAAARARRQELQLQLYAQLRLEVCYTSLAAQRRARDGTSASHAAEAAELTAQRAAALLRQAQTLRASLPALRAALPPPLEAMAAFDLQAATAAARSLAQQALSTHSSAREAFEDFSRSSALTVPPVEGAEGLRSALTREQLLEVNAGEFEARAERAQRCAAEARSARAELQQRCAELVALAAQRHAAAGSCVAQATALSAAIGSLVERDLTRELAALSRAAREFDVGGAAAEDSGGGGSSRVLAAAGAAQRLSEAEAALDAADAAAHARQWQALQERVLAGLQAGLEALEEGRAGCAEAAEAAGACSARASSLASACEELRALEAGVGDVGRLEEGRVEAAAELLHRARTFREAATTRVAGLERELAEDAELRAKARDARSVLMNPQALGLGRPLTPGSPLGGLLAGGLLAMPWFERAKAVAAATAAPDAGEDRDGSSPAAAPAASAALASFTPPAALASSVAPPRAPLALAPPPPADALQLQLAGAAPLFAAPSAFPSPFAPPLLAQPALAASAQSPARAPAPALAPAAAAAASPAGAPAGVGGAVRRSAVGAAGKSALAGGGGAASAAAPAATAVKPAPEKKVPSYMLPVQRASKS